MKSKEASAKKTYASKQAGNYINMYSVLQFEPNPQIMTDISRIKQEQIRTHSSFTVLNQKDGLQYRINICL